MIEQRNNSKYINLSLHHVHLRKFGSNLQPKTFEQLQHFSFHSIINFLTPRVCSTRIRNCFNSLIARINLRALNNYETPAFDARKIIDASKPFHHCLRAYLYTTTYGHATTSVIKTMHGYSSVPLRTTPLCTALKTRNENRLLGETLKINKETRETRLIAGKYSTAKIASRRW